MAAHQAWRSAWQDGALVAVVLAARCAFCHMCCRAWALFVWALEFFRGWGPLHFWSLLKVCVLAPVPALSAFEAFFCGLFGGGTSSSEPEELVAWLDAAKVPEFMAAEV